jgi:ATP-dependent Clp protease ATP-binding subunit ClpA
VIQRRLQNPLATFLLKGEIGEDKGIHVDFKDDEFAFEMVPVGQSKTAETVS